MNNSLLMQSMTRRTFVSAVAATSLQANIANSPAWIDLFDGRTLNGWRPSEHKSSWTVTNGMLTANGPRSHLFYVGSVNKADFKNFELEVELTTQPDCNSGIYFHTTYQESGFPEKGFEVQVNNTARGDGGYLERKKTGSLYGLRNMYKQLAQDQKPFGMAVTVRGKNVQIRLNGQLLVDYMEPTPPVIPAGGEKYRFLDRGTFALQCHNEGSKAAFKSVRVRPLPDDLPNYTGLAPVVDDTYRDIINIGRHNLPMVDFHVYLTPDFSLEQALQKSRQDGIQYGITAKASTLKTETAIERWMEHMTGRPVFLGLATENGDWMKNLSQNAAARFDYVVANCSDATAETVLKRLHNEPIDILSGLNSVPKEHAEHLIAALLENKVALELNTVHRTPSEAFILQAKNAGCKFSFGTANANAAEVQRCEYGLQAVAQCKLDWQNFFTPGGWWPKAVSRRWSSGNA